MPLGILTEGSIEVSNKDVKQTLSRFVARMSLENIHKNCLKRLSWEADPVLHYESTVNQVDFFVKNIFLIINDFMIGGQEGQISEPQEKRKLELIICESETKKICSTKYLKESETEKTCSPKYFYLK